MLVDEFASWDAKTRDNFSYQPDPSDRDTWRSHYDDVMKGRPWCGDCDDLAETVMDILCRRGLPLENAYRLVLQASDGSGGHMAGAVVDIFKTIWIIGDTYVNRPYRAEKLLHTPVKYNRLSEFKVVGENKIESTWRAGAPWTLETAS